MASELEPLAHDWCEGFICPLRVVGREWGVLRPDLRYPWAESLCYDRGGFPGDTLDRVRRYGVNAQELVTTSSTRLLMTT